jgi:hypothetical protein
MQRNAMIAAANSNRVDLLPIIDSFATSDDEVLQATSLWCSSKLKSSNQTAKNAGASL